jgi:hypothetical protein
MRIVIETIEHKDQRYPTVGDWFFDHTYECKKCSKTILVPRIGPTYCLCGERMVLINTTINIRVSRLSDWRREALVAVHELIECLLCEHRGISAESVDDFDKKFEVNRLPGNEDEPGDHPNAPYRNEHFFATNVEALLSAELEVNFQEYEKEIAALP